MKDSIRDSRGDANVSKLADSLSPEGIDAIVTLFNKERMNRRHIRIHGNVILTEIRVDERPMRWSITVSSNKTWPRPPTIPP